METVYGDTHVEPARLFDPTREAPPPDAIDVYFNTPLSLSLLGDAYAHQGMQRDLDKLLDLYMSLGARVVTTLQRQGGYVAGGRPGSQSVPARLALAAMAHNAVPGESTMRLHLHVYVGARASALHDDRQTSVDQARFDRAVRFAWTDYLGVLERETTRSLGVTWDQVPGRSSTEQEIVDPPMIDHIEGHELGVCPGDFGPRTQVMADAWWRSNAAESARLLAEESRRRTG